MEGVSGPGSGAGGWTAQHPSRSVPCREGFRSPDGVCFVPYSGFLSASRDWGRLGGLGPHWGFRLTAESLSQTLAHIPLEATIIFPKLLPASGIAEGGFLARWPAWRNSNLSAGRTGPGFETLLRPPKWSWDLVGT